MSKKTFKEIKEEIRSAVKKSASGEPVKTFSKTSFDKMATALLNDKDHTVEVVKTKNGEIVTEKIKPVESFRNGFLKKIVTDAGVDKHEAKTFVDNYEITNVDGLYEALAETVFQYLDADKAFPFLTREDCKATLYLKSVPETEKDHRNPKGDGIVHVKTASHNKVVVKAPAPEWLKTRKKK